MLQEGGRTLILLVEEVGWWEKVAVRLMQASELKTQLWQCEQASGEDSSEDGDDHDPTRGDSDGGGGGGADGGDYCNEQLES